MNTACWAVTIAIAAAGGEAPQRRVAVSSRITVKVSDPEATADLVVAKAAARSGYLHALDAGTVRVKVPTDQLDALRAEVSSLGVVIGRDYRADDVGEAIDRVATRLASRRHVLDQYVDLLRNAEMNAVVTVERQVMQLVTEIERMQGQLRLLRHRLANAELQVDFQAPDRRPPAPAADSPFPWLNTVSLADLFGDFERAR